MPMMGIPFMGEGIIPLLITVFWIWMLIDCILNRKLHGGSKVCWLLIIFFTNFFGALIYFFMECSHRNPLEALSYYTSSFTQATRPTAMPGPPLYTPPPRPINTPPASDYGDYAQGYHAREPLATSAQATTSSATDAPAQAEYEQTIISYPEMPPPQQGG